LLELIKDIISIDMLKTVLYYTEIFFVVYMLGYSTFLFVSVLVGGNQLFEDVKKKKLRNEINHDYYVPISIIVPAYNEEVTIADTIRSLLNLDYKLYEIIVVNDGSKDDTAKIVEETFGLKQVNRPIRNRLNVKSRELFMKEKARMAYLLY